MHAFGGMSFRIIPHGAKRCCNGQISDVNTIHNVFLDKVKLNISQLLHLLQLNKMCLVVYVFE